MNDEITAHYSFGGLRERIEKGLSTLGEEPSVASLGAVDEFHLGGRPATQRLIDQLALGDQDRVLDIGSGLGGTARYIADTTHAHVTGVDLTEEYVDVARWLTELVGLTSLVQFLHGSAADLPEASEPFTAATMVHVGMNIADKEGVFAQLATRLVPGGTFAIYDIMQTGSAAPSFPMPWAASEATSALETADTYCTVLRSCGFTIENVQNRADAALTALAQQRAAATGGPSPLGLHLVMGPTTPTKIGNLAAAVGDGIVAPTEIIARLG